MAAPPIPRPRADLIAELHRCAGTRRHRQEQLLEALVMIDAIDQRMAALVDELALHERAPR